MVTLIARTLVVALTFHVAHLVVGPPSAQEVRLRHSQLLHNHGRRAALAQQQQPWTQILDLLPASAASNSSSTPLVLPSILSSSANPVTTTATTTTVPVPTTTEQLLNPITDDAVTMPPFFDQSEFDYCFPSDDLSKVRQPWTADAAFGPTVVVYGLAFALGFLGNLFVVIALLADRKWDSAGGGGGGGATNSFLVSLAVADVLFLVVCLPFEIGVKLSEAWQAGKALCKLLAFVEMATATASVLNLTAVSIERFVD
jgi:hypothetical protein